MRTSNFLTLPFADHRHDLPVQTRFEACGGFSADAADSPVCVACGWLAAEHSLDAIGRRLAS
jgi:hypothetical protein